MAGNPIVISKPSQENFKNMVELSSQLKESYTARLRIEVENLEAPPRPASSLKYVPGKEFVPRPNVPLRKLTNTLHNI